MHRLNEEPAMLSVSLAAKVAAIAAPFALGRVILLKEHPVSSVCVLVRERRGLESVIKSLEVVCGRMLILSRIRHEKEAEKRVCGRVAGRVKFMQANVTFAAEQVKRSSVMELLTGLITTVPLDDAMLTSPCVIEVGSVSSLSVPAEMVTVRASGPIVSFC